MKKIALNKLQLFKLFSKKKNKKWKYTFLHTIRHISMYVAHILVCMYVLQA